MNSSVETCENVSRLAGAKTERKYPVVSKSTGSRTVGECVPLYRTETGQCDPFGRMELRGNVTRCVEKRDVGSGRHESDVRNPGGASRGPAAAGPGDEGFERLALHVEGLTLGVKRGHGLGVATF